MTGAVDKLLKNLLRRVKPHNVQKATRGFGGDMGTNDCVYFFGWKLDYLIRSFGLNGKPYGLKEIYIIGSLLIIIIDKHPGKTGKAKVPVPGCSVGVCKAAVFEVGVYDSRL